MHIPKLNKFFFYHENNRIIKEYFCDLNAIKFQFLFSLNVRHCFIQFISLIILLKPQ